MGIKKTVILYIIIACLLMPVFAAYAEGTTHKIDSMYGKKATANLDKRYPGEAYLAEDELNEILKYGNVQKTDVLDKAFACLETGNPFTTRYNAITKSDITPLLEYGIPYFYGGRKIKNILCKAPAYRTWKEWQDSVYYRKGAYYFLGFDCKGFVDYVLKEAGIKELSIAKGKSKDSYKRRVLDSTQIKDVDWSTIHTQMEVGDVLAVWHPTMHRAIFIGTLADYGYTEKDFPNDPGILTYPLVIHCGTNAVYADWFYKLKKNSTDNKYKRASVPDGGVTVSIVGYPTTESVKTITQQKQETSWILMPDNTWLTIISMDDVDLWRTYR